MTSDVSPEALAGLAEHFASGGRPAESGWTGPVVPVRAFDPPQFIRLQLPGFDGVRATAGTDGSFTDGSDIAGFAAVHGDGYATAGTFVGTLISSQAAEMQAVRVALRRSGEGPVTLLLDNAQVLDSVQRMARTGRLDARYCDRDMAGEIAALLRTRPVTVKHVPDIEGGTDWNRIPSHPLMAAAHRLAWSIRRLTADGLPIQGDALKWLNTVAVAETRRTSGIRQQYDALLRRIGRSS